MIRLTRPTETYSPLIILAYHALNCLIQHASKWWRSPWLTSSKTKGKESQQEIYRRQELIKWILKWAKKTGAKKLKERKTRTGRQHSCGNSLFFQPNVTQLLNHCTVSRTVSYPKEYLTKISILFRWLIQLFLVVSQCHVLKVSTWSERCLNSVL